MNISCFDDTIPYNVRQHILSFCANSKFILGWSDGLKIENDKAIPNLHSSWTENDLEESNILPYIIESIDKTSWFTKKSLKSIKLNLVKSDDVHFIHSHPNEYVALYYVNLNWEDGWYGETIYHDPIHVDEVIFTSLYKPGRIILFDGQIPHSIRPQSTRGPKYRMTLSLFFVDNNTD